MPSRPDKRRRLLLAGGLLGALAVAAAIVLPITLSGGGGDDAILSFRTEPALRPPAIEVDTIAPGKVGDGLVFIAPKERDAPNALMIADNQGNPLWYSQLPPELLAMDFHVEEYRGEEVLTWWEGEDFTFYGEGEYVLMDSGYREVARVRAGSGLETDLHDIAITDEGTALVMSYRREPHSLEPVGGSASGMVLDCVVQEIDIESGEVLFRWSAIDHVPLTESVEQPNLGKPALPYDFFHLNSVSVDVDGNLLLSARHTNTVYKVDRETGDIIWRLGGKRSDFEMGPDASFIAQHDAEREDPGPITIFDNGSPGPPDPHGVSRGIALSLDLEAMRAELVREWEHPEGGLATSQGNVQTLPARNAFVGWGSLPSYTEFTDDGRVVYHAEFADAGVESYRAYREQWVGRPAAEPEVVAEPGTVYVSWNGATEVESWELLAGADEDSLDPVTTVPFEAFETTIPIETDDPYAEVHAIDARGRTIGKSDIVRLPPSG